eukprot:TRINITY_DN7377_c0_g1_i1.p1 TRINITY_DN7377_c0_g1~~TRINITY_DN7377_c0_g1_i1.p1  ORF type:complete len:349 (+),score=65.42 TRINITY_DN7377_c0_g1_i1:222-1268(+)
MNWLIISFLFAGLALAILWASFPTASVASSGSRVFIMLSGNPSVWMQFPGLLWAAICKRRGVPARPDPFCRIEVSAHKIRLSPQQQRTYLEACVCPSTGTKSLMPPLLPAVMASGLTMYLVKHRRFPVSPLGLDTVRSVFRVQRPITFESALDFSVVLESCRATSRGFELTVVESAFLSRTGEFVWSHTRTLLSRKGGASDAADTTATDHPPFVDEQAIAVPDDIDRRFAGLSGDWSQRGVFGFARKLLGRRGAPHLWACELCLSVLRQSRLFPSPPFVVDFELRRPPSVPSLGQVIISDLFKDDGVSNYLAFRLVSSRGEPHVVGRLSFFDQQNPRMHDFRPSFKGS